MADDSIVFILQIEVTLTQTHDLQNLNKLSLVKVWFWKTKSWSIWNMAAWTASGHYRWRRLGIVWEPVDFWYFRRVWMVTEEKLSLRCCTGLQNINVVWVLLQIFALLIPVFALYSCDDTHPLVHPGSCVAILQHRCIDLGSDFGILHLS